MSDATHSNPSDPNSMFDQGETRNAVYNVNFQGLPDGTAASYSKALGVHNKGSHNNTFYSFGARYTNISDHFYDESQASRPQCPQTDANHSISQFDKLREPTSTAKMIGMKQKMLL